MHKEDILQKVSQESSIQDQKTINVMTGQPYVLEVDVNNPFEKKQTYKVLIDDMDFKNGHIAQPELTVVDNSHSEWEYWYKEGRCSLPMNWQIVNASTNEITLDPFQKTKLLLKFQSFRQPLVESTSGSSSQYDPVNDLKPRQIKVEIVNDNKFAVQQMQVNVHPRQMVCDQIFRYFEAENTKSDIKVPNFLKHEGIGELLPLNLCKVKCQNKKMRLKVISDEAMQATVFNDGSGSCQKGYVFVYKDEFLTKLLGVCCIEVRALNFITFIVRAGQEYDYNLKVYNTSNKEGEIVQRVVEMFSTDPHLITPPFGKKRNIHVLKEYKNKFSQKIPINIMSKHQGVFRAMVNCVDINSKAIMDAFLFEIQAEKAEIDRTITFKTKAEQEKKVKVIIANPFNEKVLFSLVSTDDKVLRVVSRVETFTIQARRDIEVVLPAQRTMGKTEAILQVNRVQEEENSNFTPYSEGIKVLVEVE